MRLLLLTLLFSMHVCADENSIFSKTYDFNPHELTSEEIQSKSADLDVLWKEVSSSPTKYITELRASLATSNYPPFFYYNGSMLLLKLSDNESDKKLVASSLAKVDLKDIQHTEYLKSVHRLAVSGFNITDAALNILKYDEFQIFIPLHYLTLNQDFSLIYMLMPLDESIYISKLVKELANKQSETSTKSLLLAIWYSSTVKGNEAISNFIDDTNNSNELIEYAKELANRNENIGMSFSMSSIASLREERREVMSRISDEALYELNSLTKKIIAKMN